MILVRMDNVSKPEIRFGLIIGNFNQSINAIVFVWYFGFGRREKKLIFCPQAKLIFFFFASAYDSCVCVSVRIGEWNE